MRQFLNYRHLSLGTNLIDKISNLQGLCKYALTKSSKSKDIVAWEK